MRGEIPTGNCSPGSKTPTSQSGGQINLGKKSKTRIQYKSTNQKIKHTIIKLHNDVQEMARLRSELKEKQHWAEEESEMGWCSDFGDFRWEVSQTCHVTIIQKMFTDGKNFTFYRCTLEIQSCKKYQIAILASLAGYVFLCNCRAVRLLISFLYPLCNAVN